MSRFHDDPAWHDALLFHEYFRGDSGDALCTVAKARIVEEPDRRVSEIVLLSFIAAAAA